MTSFAEEQSTGYVFEGIISDIVERRRRQENESERNRTMSSEDRTVVCRVCKYPCDVGECVRCIQCSCVFCQRCEVYHKKFERSHTTQRADIPYEEPLPLSRRIGNFSDLPENEKRIVLAYESSKKSCPEHSIERLVLWCLKCQTIICTHCNFAGRHRGHPVDPYVSVVAPFLLIANPNERSSSPGK